MKTKSGTKSDKPWWSDIPFSDGFALINFGESYWLLHYDPWVCLFSNRESSIVDSIPLTPDLTLGEIQAKLLEKYGLVFNVRKEKRERRFLTSGTNTGYGYAYQNKLVWYYNLRELTCEERAERLLT